MMWNFWVVLLVDASGYLVVDGSGVGAVEFVIRSHDVCEVSVPLAPHPLGCVALLEQVPSIACRKVKEHGRNSLNRKPGSKISI